MSDWDDRHERPQRDPTEGVRLIGADEAEEALERGDASRRLGQDEPRFGDRPPAPDGPRPALRFPLAHADDAASVERPPAAPVQPPPQAPELAHWTGSAAEEVPHMSRRDPLEGDDGGWSSFSGLGPRWRDDVPPVEPPARPGGQWPPPDPGARAPQGTPMSFDDPGLEPPPGRSVFGDEGGPAPYYDDAYGDDLYGGYGEDQYLDTYADAYADVYADDEYVDDSYVDEPPELAWAAPGPMGGPPPARRRSRSSAAPRRPSRGQDRDMRTAVGVGTAMVGVALALFYFAGPLGAMALVVPILGYATYEYMDSTHRAGLQPLLPVGVAATVGSVIAAYNYGEQAIPLALVLTTSVCFLWYLLNAGGEGPAANIGVTLLGFVWVGMFGSFAGLLLSVPTYGVSFLLAAVVPTVAYDVGGLFVGRSAGSRALSSASPNKTIEGLAGGMFLAVVAGAVFGAIGPAPFDGWGDGLKIGLVAALAAPIGDLAESLVKRDLDLKDMGNILPGHGGLLDRFDAVLFVLPAIWYLARLSDFFVL